jgi:TonB family protein
LERSSIDHGILRVMLPFILAATLAAPYSSADTCNQPPRVIKTGPLEYPSDTQFLGSGLLEVMVKITIDDTGKPVKAEVVESSGYDVFDDATLRAAEASTFAPAETACSPSPGFFLFYARFTNKYTPNPDEITPPSFTFPDGWSAASTTTPLPDGMQTVAEAVRADARLLIVAEHAASGFDADAAANRITSALKLQPLNVQSGPLPICSSFQQGWSENFDYRDGSQTRTAELVEVQGINGRFSLLYTTPKGAPDDEAMDKAIDRFCVQGAPRAVPRNLGLPVG